MSIRSCIVIGAGPAGLTAGIYLGRANLKPLLLTGRQPGGQLTTTTEIENFPGFPQGLPGPKLMEDMEAQARHCGAEIVYDEVSALEPGAEGRPHAVSLGTERLEAHTIILATGASPRLLGLPSEQTFWSRGVHTCAVCDAGFYRGREVAVVGGGDSALEEATYLAKMCAKVTVIHRRRELRASKVMQARALGTPNIEFAWDSVPEEFVGREEKGKTVFAGARLKDVKSGETRMLECAAVFLAIGHIPNTSLLRGRVDLNDEGYITVDAHLNTNVPGIFAAGDVHDRRYRQAITAAGYGCQAALEAERYLTHHGLS